MTTNGSRHSPAGEWRLIALRYSRGVIFALARKVFARWDGESGTVPVMLLVENVIGVRTVRDIDTGEMRIVWDIRLLERHGIENLVLADGTRVDLLCEARASADETPRTTIRMTRPIRIDVLCNGKETK